MTQFAARMYTTVNISMFDVSYEALDVYTKRTPGTWYVSTSYKYVARSSTQAR